MRPSIQPTPFGPGAFERDLHPSLRQSIVPVALGIRHAGMRKTGGDDCQAQCYRNASLVIIESWIAKHETRNPKQMQI
jgi:hypothetical protein